MKMFSQKNYVKKGVVFGWHRQPIFNLEKENDMEKNAIEFKGNYTLEALVALLGDLNNGFKQKSVFIVEGNEYVTLVPSNQIEVALTATSKKGKDKLSLELSWRQDSAECKHGPALSIHSAMPKMAPPAECAPEPAAASHPGVSHAGASHPGVSHPVASHTGASHPGASHAGAKGTEHETKEPGARHPEPEHRTHLKK